MGYGCDSIYSGCSSTLEFLAFNLDGFEDDSSNTDDWTYPRQNKVNIENASQRGPWVQEMGNDEKRFASVHPRVRRKDFVNEQPTFAPFYEKETLSRK